MPQSCMHYQHLSPLCACLICPLLSSLLCLFTTLRRRNTSDVDFLRETNRRGEQMLEGFRPELWDGKTAVWHSLDGHYDQ